MDDGRSWWEIETTWRGRLAYLLWLAAGWLLVAITATMLISARGWCDDLPWCTPFPCTTENAPSICGSCVCLVGPGEVEGRCVKVSD